MAGRVIQGFFLGPKVGNAAQAVPPPTRFALRAPGPPSTGFGAAAPVTQCRTAIAPAPLDAARIGMASSVGRPLPDAVRIRMEAAFGADFSAVRVHIGPQPERIGAIAFTSGNDIYFSPGRFQPDSVPGRQLLGHELAHVVQQRSGRVRNPLGSGIAVVNDPALEAEADRLGHRAAICQGPAMSRPAAAPRTPPAHSIRPRAVQRMEAIYEREQGFKFSGLVGKTPSLEEVVEPKVLDMPPWMIANNRRISEALEGRFSSMAAVDLGTFVLPDSGIRSARLENPDAHPPTMGSELNGFKQIETDEVLKSAIVNAVIDGLKLSGHLQYLRNGLLTRQENTQETWVAKINVHYYRDRDKSQIGLHKDGRGDVPFFSLMYLNEDRIAGPETVFNPPPVHRVQFSDNEIFDYEQMMLDNMPPFMRDDVGRIKGAFPINREVREHKVEPYGMVSLMNSLSHHGTPLRGNRTLQNEEQFESIGVYVPHHGTSYQLPFRENSGRRTLTRRLSNSDVRDSLPPNTDAPRRFFRVWVRTVRKTA